MRMGYIHDGRVNYIREFYLHDRRANRQRMRMGYIHDGSANSLGELAARRSCILFILTLVYLLNLNHMYIQK